MRKIIPILLAILILIPVFVVAGGQEQTHNVIIKYKDQPQENSMRLFSTQTTIEIPEEKINYNFGDVKYATLSQSEIEDLSKNSNIKIFPEPVKHIVMDDSIYLTNSTDAWYSQVDSINITGKGETICIIDTGINLTHPDLGNCYGDNNPASSCKILGGWDYCADDSNCQTEDSIPNDANGHGTHVAGIAAANGNLKGIAPDAKLIILKVFNGTGATSDTPILKAMDWCINNATKFNISTISMSLGNSYAHNSYCDDSNIGGVEYNPPYTEKINLARSMNITVTIATGNDNYEDGIASPACIENATRVGSITKSNIMSGFSNTGNFFTDLLLTYGELINSTIIKNPQGNTLDWCGDENSYCTMSGTSMSTPMAAGIITLLRQYKKLESNINLTTNYIEEILINSSTPYEDIPSNGNYSIINSLAAILYSDDAKPQTAQVSPQDLSLVLIGNQTFSCNATDNLQLKNLTLNIYNSTGLFYNTTNSSPANNVLIINESVNLSIADDYTWNCISYDNQSNLNQTANRTVSTYSIQTQIAIPTNNTYTNQNETSFNCSAQSTNELSNITFSIYNSTSLINSTTRNISGLTNSSIFNFTLPNETIYYYNCKAVNNQSQESQIQNHTITYDITLPQITPTSPANNARITSPATFTYSETETNPSYCNLTINNELKSSFTQTLADGTYYWNITCTDLANNTNTSETRLLTIYTEPPAPTSSGGGGGGTPSIKTYILKESETEAGITQKLKANDKIKFTAASESHQITLDKVEADKVEITIESSPIIATLYLNSPTKINLNNDDTFDLELTLLSTASGYANIKIQTITEPVPIKTIQTPEMENRTTDIINQTSDEEPLKEKSTILKKIMNVIKSILRFFGIRI